VPRIYVGNLAESVTRDDLRALFSKIGRVGGALVITDKLTGKSRGFGFVEMIEVDDAINAAVFFSGAELEAAKFTSIHTVPRNPVLKNIAANASAALLPSAAPAMAPRSRVTVSGPS